MYSPATLIQTKRDGGELAREQIKWFIRGLGTGEVADYQATAFLMAVYFQGMSLAETVALTEAMLESGVRYDLSTVPGVKVDKHSTGGVGDKVSLILAPLASACGLRVPMMSGRGLGHSGGTLDKLESIRGFDVNLSPERFKELLASIGCAMIGQSERIAPADKKLYALRDVTATVECIPLITASILSKKLAEGTDGLVLDVKVGSGAFMKSKDQARKLARSIIQVGRRMGLRTRAILTNMDQPLGYAVGNAVEMAESIEILRGGHVADLPRAGECSSSDLKELTIQLCAQMLELGGVVRNLPEGRKLAHAKLADGTAWERFREMVRQQGGSLEQVDDPTRLPKPARYLEWRARKRGYITRMDTEAIGRILVDMGGGRHKATDPVDPSVGLLFHRKLGAIVRSGDPLVTVCAPGNGVSLEELEARFHQAIEISGARKPVPKLIHEVIA